MPNFHMIHATWQCCPSTETHQGRVVSALFFMSPDYFTLVSVEIRTQLFA